MCPLERLLQLLHDEDGGAAGLGAGLGPLHPLPRKTRGHFPNDDAALRLIWLAIMRAKTN
jgi:hypothetical protein